MSLAKGTVSGIVSRMESMGYIKKIKNDEDKRNTYITFSYKGEEFAKEFRKTINDSFDNIFKNFTEEEIIELKKKFNIKSFTVVADRGLNSKGNIDSLVKLGDNYVLSSKIRGASDDIQSSGAF